MTQSCSLLAATTVEEAHGFLSFLYTALLILSGKSSISTLTRRLNLRHRRLGVTISDHKLLLMTKRVQAYPTIVVILRLQMQAGIYL